MHRSKATKLDLGAPGFEPGKADYESAVLPIETTLPKLQVRSAKTRPSRCMCVWSTYIKKRRRSKVPRERRVGAPGLEPGKAD